MNSLLCSFLVLVTSSVFAYDMEFVPIPKREVYYKGDKYPVKLIQEFEMQVAEMTQLQYFKVMKANPSRFQGKAYCPGEYRVIDVQMENDKSMVTACDLGQIGVKQDGTTEACSLHVGRSDGEVDPQDGLKREQLRVGMCPNHPVENVSRNQVQEFIAKLNAERDDGYGYRLPTSGEWSYATKAGNKGDYFFGGNPLLLSSYSWYWINSGGGTHAVKQKLANPWGLHDVYGNVWEWVSDEYMRELPKGVTLPPGSGGSSGGYYMTRGGGWGSGPHDLRSNSASFGHRYSGYDFIGFRLLRIRLQK